MPASEATEARQQRGRALLWWLAAYLVIVSAIGVGLWEGRQRTLATLGTPQARAEWQAWKTQVAQQAEESGGVARRVPKSDEPPALILMRDHFGAVLSASLIISTCLFLFLLLVARGASQSRSSNS